MLVKKYKKNYDDWINDQENKFLKDIPYKWLYDYWVTSWCTLDWKVIWEKKLISIFWKRNISQSKTSLERKESFRIYGRWSYDYTLDLSPYWEHWIMHLTLSEEFKDCTNWHYYAWTSYNNFIYVERD